MHISALSGFNGHRLCFGKANIIHCLHLQLKMAIISNTVTKEFITTQFNSRNLLCGLHETFKFDKRSCWNYNETWQIWSCYWLNKCNRISKARPSTRSYLINFTSWLVHIVNNQFKI